MVLRVAIVLVSVASLAVLSSGCSPNKGSGSLDGTEWNLAIWSSTSVDPGEFGITARFEDGQIAGRSAVNSYSASYSTSRDGGFEVGEIASTLMAGPEPAMEAERIYFELLRKADGYTLKGNELTLLVEGGEEYLGFSRSR